MAELEGLGRQQQLQDDDLCTIPIPSHQLEDDDLCQEPPPPSPITSPSHPQSAPAPLSSLSMHESLLLDAWERKRELMLQDELSNFKEHAIPHLLGRSTSDCGNPMRESCNRAQHELLERSLSDCGKTSSDPLITPNRRRRTRTRSLTDDDFEELKGCIDLGFRFDQNSIPDLSNTLPALEVYCAVTQSFQESLDCMSPGSESPKQSSTTPSWRITSPGDDPEDVKERLRHWAQAVACNARICY